MQKKTDENTKQDEGKVTNKDFEGVDKAPGEEQGKGEPVTNDDLKGKKVDADPTRPFDKPISQLP